MKTAPNFVDHFTVLSDFVSGTNNNFNLIRLIAALAVLVTHSFALAIGTGDAEPFQNSLGMTIGSIAVDIFFIASGFLVTSSLLTRQSTIDFFWARVLRIFPALIVMLLLTVFGLGIFFTASPLSSYLIDSNTYIYLLKCATLVTGVVYNLPGVFDGNPYKNTVNGSLWTMPYEIKMYAILAGLWITLRVTNKNRLRLFQIMVVTGFVASGIFVVASHLYAPATGKFIKLFFMFFSGAAFYILKGNIPVSRLLFWTFVAALLMSVGINKTTFNVIYVLTIAYVLFYFAYIPSGWIRRYNELGDYSYGIYIYAFPVQQSIAALLPGVSVFSMILVSGLVTLLLAVLSWHIFERRALALKGFCAARTRSFFSRSSLHVLRQFSKK